MASSDLKRIVAEIQYRAELTLDEIAKKAGYSKAYFRNEVSKGESDAIAEALRTKFNDILVDYGGGTQRGKSAQVSSGDLKQILLRLEAKLDGLLANDPLSDKDRKEIGKSYRKK